MLPAMPATASAVARLVWRRYLLICMIVNPPKVHWGDRDSGDHRKLKTGSCWVEGCSQGHTMDRPAMLRLDYESMKIYAQRGTELSLGNSSQPSRFVRLSVCGLRSPIDGLELAIAQAIMPPPLRRDGLSKIANWNWTLIWRPTITCAFCFC